MVFTRFVQAGRGVIITDGPLRGSLAFIVDIVDTKRSIIEGPTTGVPRQVIHHNDIDLTDYLLEDVKRGIESDELKELLEKSNIVGEWEETPMAKNIKLQKIKETLTDFDKYVIRQLRTERHRLLASSHESS